MQDGTGAGKAADGKGDASDIPGEPFMVKSMPVMCKFDCSSEGDFDRQALRVTRQSTNTDHQQQPSVIDHRKR
jgi:hypothetical protein